MIHANFSEKFALKSTYKAALRLKNRNTLQPMHATSAQKNDSTEDREGGWADLAAWRRQ